jgi:hypothetical protein
MIITTITAEQGVTALNMSFEQSYNGRVRTVTDSQVLGEDKESIDNALLQILTENEKELAIIEKHLSYWNTKLSRYNSIQNCITSHLNL